MVSDVAVSQPGLAWEGFWQVQIPHSKSLFVRVIPPALRPPTVITL